MTVTARRPAGAAGDVLPLPEPEVFALYGLAIRSDVPLPCPVALSGTAGGIAWEIRLASVDDAPKPDGVVVSESACDLACHAGAVYSWIRRSQAGAWFWWERAGTCHVRSSNDRVDVFLDPDASQRALALMLIGQVAGLLMVRRGIPCLHASAVVVDGKAVAFIAPPGHGKSTLAAGFVRRGASLLTDDVLPLVRGSDAGRGEIVGHPSLPLMKVWHDTARHELDLDFEPPAAGPLVEKPLVADRERLRFAERPAPLRAIYVVNRYDPVAASTTAVRSERLGPREAITALIAQTYRADVLTPAEMAGLLPIYAQLAARAPVRLLSYPSGFDRQGATQARVLADLGAA
jgi:hypothetical protein